MSTKEVRDQYLEKIRGEKSKWSVYNSMAVLNSVSQYEEKIGKTMNMFSDDDFQHLFEENGWIGMSNVTACKSRIMDFIRWDMLNNNTIYNVREIPIFSSDVKAQDDYKNRYFESEEDFLGALRVFSCDEKYYRAAALCALYWTGFSQKEAISVKKNDLNDENHTISGRQCTESIYDIVKNCALSSGYTVLVGSSAAERRVVYVGSDLVLRQGIWNAGLTAGIEAQKEELNNSVVSKILREVNLILKNLPENNRYHGKKLNQTSIGMNAKFCKMYDAEISLKNPSLFIATVKNDYDAIGVLSELFPEENWERNLKNKQYYRLMEQYKIWKDCFHK